MHNKPTALLFLNDWRVDPNGANCGGGEIATISLAEALVNLGYKTICCGNLTVPEGNYRGVDYWSFGESYDLAALQQRIATIGSFYCFAATLVHPFLFLKPNSNCLAKILINHSPGIVSSGLEPRTVAHLVDYHVCVSEAQKQLILMRGDVPADNMVVVKNGFDPKQFQHTGPQNRDFRRLMFAGRLESAKGIHHLLGAYVELKKEFPDLKLDLFGSQDHWADLNAELARLQAQDPNLIYHGKVTRAQIAEHMRKVGLLVFPSLSFETAGLVVLEAQGSGCPVVANRIGGVPEYIDPKCAVLTDKHDATELTRVIAELLRNPNRLKEMSLHGQSLATNFSWDNTARQLLKLAEMAAQPENINSNQVKVPDLVYKYQPLKRSWNYQNIPFQQLLDDHDVIASGSLVSDEQITQILEFNPEFPMGHLWQGLRYDQIGNKKAARNCYQTALKLSGAQNWQSLFRLIMIDAELGNFEVLAANTRTLLANCPGFPFKSQLERLLTETSTYQQK